MNGGTAFLELGKDKMSESSATVCVRSHERRRVNAGNRWSIAGRDERPIAHSAHLTQIVTELFQLETK
jgi:hypothetical protein